LKTSNLLILTISLAAIAGAIVLYLFDPSTHSFYPPCVFRSMTGLLCPGCGITRALHQLLHGRIADAFHYNAVVLVLGPLLVGSAAVKPRLLYKPWLAWAVIAILLAWGVVRNLVHL
jgi:hypothetical protein